MKSKKNLFSKCGPGWTFLHSLAPRSNRRGIALLLVVVIVTALFSISLGIFSILFGQLLISGEAGHSQIAMYAADQGIERSLYRDRVLQPPATPDGLCSPLTSPLCPVSESVSLPSGGCFTMQLTKTGGAATSTNLVVDGQQYPCGTSSRIIRRRFEVNY